MTKKITIMIAIFGLLFSLLSFTYGIDASQDIELSNEIHIDKYYNPLARGWIYPDQTISKNNDHRMTYYLDGVKIRDGVETPVYGDPIIFSDILPNRWKVGDIFDDDDTGRTLDPGVPSDLALINAFDITQIPVDPTLAKPMFRGFTNGGQAYYNLDVVADASGAFIESEYAQKNYHPLSNYLRYPAFGDDNRDDVYQRYLGRGNEYFDAPIVQENLRNLKAEYFPNSPNMTLRFLYDHFNPLSIQTQESVGSWVAWWYNDYYGNNRYRTFTIPPLKVYENDLIAEDIVIEDSAGRDVTGELLDPSGRYTVHYNVSTTNDYSGPIELTAYYFTTDTQGQYAMVGGAQDLGVNADLSAGEIVAISHEISGIEDLRIRAGISNPIENASNSVRANDLFDYETPEPIFNLRATNFDLSGDSVYAGGRVEASVDFVNDSNQSISTIGYLVVDGVVEESFDVTLVPRGSASFRHDFSLTESSEVYYEVNPNRDLAPETTYADNRTNIRQVVINNGLCPIMPLPDRNVRDDEITYDMDLYRYYQERDKIYDTATVTIPGFGSYSYQYWTGEYTSWYDVGWRRIDSETSGPINIKEEYNITDIEYRSKWNDHEWTEDGVIKAG